jgi:hypothetical protein
MIGVGDVVSELHEIDAKGKYLITLDLESKASTIPQMVSDRLAEQEQKTPKKNESDASQRLTAQTYFTVEQWTNTVSNPATFSTPRTATYLIIGTESSANMGIIYISSQAQLTLSDQSRLYQLSPKTANGHIKTIAQIYQSSNSGATISDTRSSLTRGQTAGEFSSSGSMTAKNSLAYIDSLIYATTRNNNVFFKNYRPVVCTRVGIYTEPSAIIDYTTLPDWTDSNKWAYMTASDTEKISIDDVFNPGVESTPNTYTGTNPTTRFNYINKDFSLYKAGLAAVNLIKEIRVTAIAKCSASWTQGPPVTGSATYGTNQMSMWTLQTESISSTAFRPIGMMTAFNALSGGWFEWRGTLSFSGREAYSNGEPTGFMTLMLSNRPTTSDTCTLQGSDFIFSYVDIAILHSKSDLGAGTGWNELPLLTHTETLTSADFQQRGSPDDVLPESAWRAVARGQEEMPKGWKVAPSHITKITMVRKKIVMFGGGSGTVTESRGIDVNIPLIWGVNTNEKGALFQNGTVRGDRVFMKFPLTGLYHHNWTELDDAGKALNEGTLIKVIIDYTYRPLALIVDSYINDDAFCDRIQTDFTQIYDSTSLDQPATLSWKQRITASTQRIHSYGSAFTIRYLNNGLDTSFKGTDSADTWEVHNRYVDGITGIEKTEDKQVTLLVRADRL